MALPFFITWHTFGSRFSRCSHTCGGLSCTCGQSQEPEDRQGLDQSAESRWTAAPECKQKADVGTKKQPMKIAVLHEIPTLEIVRAGLH
jgi:hypothetical protein